MSQLKILGEYRPLCLWKNLTIVKIEVTGSFNCSCEHTYARLQFSRLVTILGFICAAPVLAEGKAATSLLQHHNNIHMLLSVSFQVKFIFLRFTSINSYHIQQMLCFCCSFTSSRFHVFYHYISLFKLCEIYLRSYSNLLKCRPEI